MSDKNISAVPEYAPGGFCPALMGGRFLNVSVERKGNVAVVSVSGTVDLRMSPALRERIIGLADAGVRGLVMDMSKVKYLDSSGMATLVEMLNRLQETSGDMVVAGLPNAMREMFGITRLDKRFRFAEDVGVAVDEIRKVLGDGA